MANAVNMKYKGYQICHLNIRSLLRHKDELALTLSNNDIICVSETWLTDKIPDSLLEIPSFNFIRQDRNNPGKKKKGGGILVYYKDFLSPFVTPLPELNTNDSNFEQLWLRLDKPGWKRLYVATGYRPPSGKIDAFINILKQSINGALNQHHNCPDLIILGDFNVDYSKTRHPDRRTLKNLFDDLGLKQIINTPTRITNKCKSVIDLIITNILGDTIAGSGVFDVIISDHLPVYINIKKSRKRHQHIPIYTRLYRLYSYENFSNTLLDNQQWCMFWNNANSIDECWYQMQEIVLDSLNKICPLKKIVRRIDQYPWVDKELLTAISLKNRLYKMAARKNGDNNYWKDYKNQRSIVRRLLISKRRNYIMHTLNNNRDDPKRFWKEVSQNLHFGKTRSDVSPIQLKNESGDLLSGLDASNILNQYYATVGERLALKFAPPNATNINRIPNQHYPMYEPMVFRFVDIREMTSLVKSLKNNNPLGIPHLKTTILKDALKILVLELTFLINKCLDNAYVPLTWKKGIITPIPKVSCCTSPSDYRPISVLPAVSKILERAVYNQLVYYLEVNGLLDSRQHGFRRGRSTLSAIYEVVQHLYDNMDQGNITYCAFIDYSKAFDTLDHAILLRKLHFLGISAHVVSWCRSYLESRQQSVKNQTDVSRELTIKYGVPQGSILGPLFFIIYVNDLLQEFGQLDPKITLYADDTVIYVSSKSPRDACKRLENGLTKLSRWCNTNKLSINVKKTKLLVVDLQSVCTGYAKPKLNGQELDQVNSYNYLGVSIDDKLDFGKFLREKYGKVHSRVYQLGKMRKYINSSISCIIYKQMIVPLSDYSDFMIRSGPQNEISRLVKLHERAIRIIDNKQHPGLSEENLAEIHRIPPIKIRQDEHLLSMMYRLSKKDELLEHERPNIHLRGRNKIKFKKYKRTYEKYLKSPLARGISLWDRLPENVQKSTTKFKFKKCIQDILY